MPSAGYSGSDSFTYTATNATGTSAAATVTITVSPPTLTFTPAAGSLTGGAVGAAYSETVTASGGTAPYNYEVTFSSLPAGLSLGGDHGQAGKAEAAAAGIPRADEEAEDALA